MEIETGSESVTQKDVTQKERRPPPAPAVMSAVWSESPRGAPRSPAVRRALIASIAGCVVLGGVLVLWPGGGGKAAPPALGPAAQ